MMGRPSFTPRRLPVLLLALICATVGARAEEAPTEGSASEAVTLETFTALPALRQLGIRVTEFQATDGLYLLRGVRRNPRGEEVPASLAVSRDLRYSFLGRIRENDSGREVYLRQPMEGYAGRASFSQGDGPRAYFIFTDTECTWCAKLEAELVQRPLPAGVTLHYYLYPLGNSERSRAKNRFILAQDPSERLAAMRRIMLQGDEGYRQSTLGEAQRDALDARIEQVRGIAREVSVRGTPTIYDTDGNRYGYQQLVTELWGGASP